MSSPFEEQWKSLFPIGAIFNSPLSLSYSSTEHSFGPLFFNPIPSSIHRLFSSPSFLPPLSPHSILNLRRFLLSSSSSTVIPSTSSSIASLLGDQPRHNDAASILRNNRLQFLRCPNRSSVVVFFPTGPNADNVGFLVVSGGVSGLRVHADGDGEVFRVESELNYQICGIAVNPAVDLGMGISNVDCCSFVDIGYLLVYSMYCVQWYVVQSNGSDSGSERVGLVQLGSKVFKTCCIVHACWSPHLAQESVVLLENGSLFLFDLEPLLKTRNRNTNAHLKGIRLRVSWDSLEKEVKWLGCEFSWHPRIFIVARSDAVFLVDFTADECSVTCLVKIETFRTYSLYEKEQFLAFSKADSNGFYFTVASNSLLLLCDVRESLTPVLQWAHGLDEPSYVNVFSLYQLRSSAGNSSFKSASESGYCIILGSFWSCEFNIFCYGPTLPANERSISSRSSKYLQSLYAWELPSNLLLTGRDCPCGSCLVREETLKDAIPEWVEWQQKKELVLGFGILDSDLSLPLPEQNEYGGFTLIRLMSSGTLEAQNYQASWNPLKRIEESHKESLDLTNYLLYGWLIDEKYRFCRRFRYFNFACLMGYLKDNLDEVLDSYMKKTYNNTIGEQSLIPEFHEFLCEKLKACGFDRFRSSPALTVVFNDISLPASIQEVALRNLWASLPMELLQLAFSSYSELLENKSAVSLEFLGVPDLPQLPPFMLRDPSGRSNKWSHKVQRTDGLVGPVLPLPVLLVLHEFRHGCSNLEEEEEEAGKFSIEAELGQQYDQIRSVAGEMAVSHCNLKVDDHAVSLADDRDYVSFDSQKPKPFFIYHPSAFNCHSLNNTQGNLINSAEVYDSLLFKLEGEKPISSDKSKDVSKELYDGLCPMELKFDALPMNFGPKELKAYGLLKRQLLKWEDSFDAYKEFCTKT